VIDLSRYVLEALRTDEELILYRGWSQDDASRALVLSAIAEYPRPESLRRLDHEFSLREELDNAWFARPIAIARHLGRTVLVFDDPGGIPLDQVLGRPLDIKLSLRLAIRLSSAIDQLHQRGIIHKDVKPGNVLVDAARGKCWLTGLGLASRLPRERQRPSEPPQFIAGTLAYMAPEQTGRMNRSIDSRSDLYSLGVTLYQLFTGTLPFTASDPMEWVHCHVARQPENPRGRCPGLPASISAVIMKLLAKTAEDRYQTASGVASDLQRCLSEWERASAQTSPLSYQIEEFSLGEHDIPDRILIPEKLYGRAKEIDALLASFDRVVVSGKPELVLVSGYSGIGKSSVVNELHKVLVPPRGLFASGKFDQYKRDIPYATLAQAFDGLIRPLLSKTEAELNHWRGTLREAVGPNGQLMVDLVPELELIIGKQVPIPDLPPQDAQRRFQMVVRGFINVFAGPDHPLSVFLDDLQWLDTATLDLLEDLLTSPDVQHLMLIGAYRNNEVSPGHPLMRKLATIRQAGAIVHDIILAPLAGADLEMLMADSLHSELPGVVALAALVHEKTGGNPFFAVQFIQTLAEEGLLTFDRGARRWSWDINRIQAKGYTDNVVDLMVGKLNRLSLPTQRALQEMACLGNTADLTTLSIVYDIPEEQVHVSLWEAARLEFVLRLESSYQFIHDRVQEAAYSLIPEELRAQSHLRIGRTLVAHFPVEKQEEAIFEIVNQFNRGASLVSAPDEREKLAKLNLIAAKRAKAATAYASALKYLVTGGALLGEDCWESKYELVFPLELDRAECEFLTGELPIAEQRLRELSSRATNAVHQAAVASLRVDLYTTLNRSDLAVDVCLEYLRFLGVEWSPHPTEEEGRAEYERIWSLIGSREIEELIELPLMSDATSLATLDVLTKVFPPALFTDANLLFLAVCRAINISLERGHSDASSVAFVWLGMIAGPHFGNYQAGFRFGRLGYELVEKRGLVRFEARTCLWFAQFVVPWTQHIRSCRDLMRRAFDAANKTGDLTIAAYSCNNLNTNFLAAGDSLVEAQKEAEHGREFAHKARFGFVTDIIDGQLGLIRTLRGLTSKFGSFDTEEFNEAGFERHLASEPSLALPECWYWIRKLQARFFAGEFEAAIDAAKNAKRLLWTSPSIFETAECHFYGALSHAALCDSANPDSHRDSSSEALAKEEHLEAVVEYYGQLQIWAKNCPDTFENRAALVAAEIARIEGRELESERFYEKAIRSANANGFDHNEALGNELAARFHSARGFEKIAQAYRRDARYYYLRWGATAKVRQLEELYPHLRSQESISGPMSTMGAPVEHLDLATVIKISQAVSSEIVLKKLIDTLMRTAVEHAGAQRGLLILPHGLEQRIEAEATTSGNSIFVELTDVPMADAALPGSIVQYVLRTRETVILDDASGQNSFSTDPYIAQHRARSVLCLPLLNQAKLIGVLYLENNLAPQVFTPTRIAVLKLLASQAAISLENTRLYHDLEAREAKIRRLVDANIMGIFIWNLQGQIIEANEALLRMVGYSRTDLSSGRVRWTDLTPAEWRDHDKNAVAQLVATGTFQPYKKEYFRNDGSRVPVLIGGAIFEGSANEGVAFVLDLTEQKQAEEALQKAHAELAHVTRILTVGELTASIAHEINQPLAAIVTNGNAGLRWLNADSPNLQETSEAIRRIVRDGKRAGEIVSRVQALFKKAPAVQEPLDINEVIQEVLTLTQTEINRYRVSLRAQLASDLPLVLGDRIQLQQVILNLVLNAVQAMSGVNEGPRQLDVISETMLVSRSGSETKNNQPNDFADANATGLLITVRDSGPGLDPQNIDRLFDAFYTTKSQGLGIGLAISRSIIEAHAGRLWAGPNSPRGAVFQFTLPVRTREISAAKH
jgi:PAS domain S-box-containing protein